MNTLLFHAGIKTFLLFILAFNITVAAGQNVQYKTGNNDWMLTHSATIAPLLKCP